MKGNSGAVPADHDVIACTDAAGRPGKVVVFGRDTEVTVIAPAGESASFTIAQARAYARAVERRATIAEGHARTAERMAATSLPVRIPDESTSRFSSSRLWPDAFVAVDAAVV